MGYAYGYGYGHTWRGTRRNTGALSGNGASMLAGETDGFATNFTWLIDAERVGVKTASVAVMQGPDTFYQNASGASPKKVYDVAGVLGWSPHNAILQSANLQASWTFTSCTAPTATFLLPTAAAANHRAFQGAGSVVGETYTHSILCSAGGYSKIGVNGGLAVGEIAFDISAGTVLYQSGQWTGTIVSQGGGQFLVSATVTNCPTGLNAMFYVLPDTYTTGIVTGSWTPDGVKGVNIFRQQVNRGAAATAHLPTTTAARIGLAIDYDPVTHVSKGLVIEPVATNLATQSAMGGGTPPTGNGATYTGGKPDPEGGLTACEVVVTTANAGLNVTRQVVGLGVGTTYTASGWCKGTAGQQIYFGDLAASQISVTFTGAWQRVSTTFVATLTGHWVEFECLSRTGGANFPAITFQVWGFQMETGALVSSYIPTFAASATRAADNYSFPLSQIPTLGSEYSMYVRFSTPVANNVRYSFVITNGTTSEFAGFYSTNGIGFLVAHLAATQANLAMGTQPANTMMSSAGRVKAGDYANSVNGLTAVVAATGVLPVVTEARLSGNNASSSSALQPFTIAKVAVITNRGWRNSELQNKSAS